MADDVTQPTDAVEQGSPTSGLYDLESVEPELRAALEPHLKAYDAEVTKKFQEAADYRKSWAPYEQLGINQIDPQVLEQLIAFSNMAQDPAQFQNWWKQVGDESNFFDAYGPEEELDLGFNELTQEQINAQITEAVNQAINPIQERFEAQDREKLFTEAETELQQELEKIRMDNPGLPEGAEEDIIGLAYRYSDSPDTEREALQKGFEDYMRLVGQGEKNLFAQKGSQPASAERSGTAATAPTPVTSFDDPRLKAQALERFKQSAS
ncbi:MAG: hypothetical protein JSS68_15035 [Actinobacteria bacterium]|nr:hypothetical protein [Actinomycetota bacterium]